MKAYLDTNLLVAASVQDHPHHVPSFELIQAVQQRTLEGCISTHGLAEFYAVITRAPFTPRVHPTEAGRFLDENILPFFELVVLLADDYKTVLRSCAAAGLIGGVVYDALHLYAAEKANCDRIYTFNIRDFRALASPQLTGKISAP
ncbi:MAG: PIN domain-containing protein [Acidobacteriota bacterium]|nr:PIN domain-containing protein [Acidobacteriota bacterium]